MTKPLGEVELRQAITDICFENGGVTKPMVDKLTALIKRETDKARIDELEQIPDEPNYGDEGRAVEYVQKRLSQLKQQQTRGDEG